MSTRESEVLQATDRMDRVRQRLERAAAGDPASSRMETVRQRLEQAAPPPGTPDGDPDPAGVPVVEEPETLGDFGGRFFHEERGRLGFLAEAGRSFARVPGQFLEGIGGVLQAAGTQDAPFAEAAEGFGEGTVFEDIAGDVAGRPGERRGRLGRALTATGVALEETGAESQEFFPRSTDPDPLDLTDINTLIAGGGEAIGQLGIQIALAAGTGGGSTITQMLMFAGPTVALEGGNAFLDTKAQLVASGMATEEAEQLASGVALTTGIGAFAIEQIPAARFVFKRIPGAEKLFGAKVANALAGRGTGLPVAMLTGAGAEATEEVLQETWSSFIQDIQAENPDAWDDIVRRLGAAATFGAIGGAFGGAVTRGAGPDLDVEEAPEGAPLPEGVEPAAGAPEPDVDVTGAPVAPEETRIERVRRRLADALHPERKQLLSDAFRDRLTGVNNRDAFQEARPRIDADPGSEVVVLDVINLHGMNSILGGQDPADVELVKMVDQLKAKAEELGVAPRDIFRSGGDEFVVVAPTGSGQSIARAIQREVGNPQIGDSDFETGFRSGVGATFEEADAAITAGKAEETRAKFRTAEGEITPEAAGVEAVQETTQPLPPTAEAADESVRGQVGLDDERQLLLDVVEGRETRPVPRREGESLESLDLVPDTATTEELEAAEAELVERARVILEGEGQVLPSFAASLRRDLRTVRTIRAETLQAEETLQPREVLRDREQIEPEVRAEPEIQVEAQEQAEDEVTALMGGRVASAEEMAEIESRVPLAEEVEDGPEELEAAALAEPAAEPAEDIQAALRRGDIDPAPSGGRPGGVRDVLEPDAPAQEAESDLDEGPDGEDRGRDRPAEPGPREGRRDAGSRSPGRLRGLDLRIGEAPALDPAKIGGGGSITKIKNNLAAIRALKAIESEGRLATAEEQRAMVLYSGWGHSPGVFDAKHKLGKRFGEELQGLLTEDEWRAARASTPNAHFTSLPVIQEMHRALVDLGLPEDASVLEPSMGVGHFLGAGPPTYNWFGIELDDITGRIAGALYPRQAVHVRGFETVKLPDDHFDAAVSNVPFGDFQVFDPDYSDLKFNIHNYFFAKAIDKVRPGGLVAFITSSFTMDSKDTRVRSYLADRADLVGAIRLPNTAFKKSAGTDVTTDIILLRKRTSADPIIPAAAGTQERGRWITVTDVETADGPVRINRYFAENADMMLGDMGLKGTMFAGTSQALVAPEGQNLRQELRTALAKLPSDVIAPRQGPASNALNIPVLDDPEGQEGMYQVVGATIMQVQGGQLVEAGVPKTQTRNVKDLIALRNAGQAVLKEQLAGEDGKVAQAELNRLYDAYVAKRGAIGKEKTTKSGTVLLPNYTPFRGDAYAPFVLALEEIDSETGVATKADIFNERVVEPRKEVEEVDRPEDALPVALAELGRVDLPWMAKLGGVTQEEMALELAGSIYLDPESRTWVPEDEYLSGNVRDKLLVAKALAEEGREVTAPGTDVTVTLEENVKALEAVQPEDLPPSAIDVGLGAPWLPTYVYDDFINELLETQEFTRVRVGHLESEALYTIEAGRQNFSVKATKEHGTQRFGAVALFEAGLNQRQPTVYETDPDGKRHKNMDQTLLAREKLQEMKDRFSEWVWQRDDAPALAREYNDRYNNTRNRVYNGAHLTPVGISPGITLLPNQKDSAWRVISSGNTLMAHAVGAGKTYTMIVASQEQRRMGLVKKPMIAVPNHMLEQFTREFLQLYPAAKVLAAEKRDFVGEKRRRLMARIATGNWDAVIVTHSGFKKIPVSRELQQSAIERELDDLAAAMASAAEASNRTIVKRLEKAKKRLEVRLQKLSAVEAKDVGLTFEELGVDQLYVDEAQYFKNLSFFTKMEGIQATASQRAQDLFTKIGYLEDLNPGRAAIFATATPISNSMAEVHVMMRYLQQPLLRRTGLESFDAWAAQFGETVTQAEIKPDGSGYRMNTRFASFKNVPELAQMFREVWDIKRPKDLNLPVPRVKGGAHRTIVSPASPELTAFVQELSERADKLRDVDPSVDNMLKITGEGRKAALDMRLIDPTAEPDPDSKVNQAADEIFDLWEDTHDRLGTQMVFIDFSTPNTIAPWNAYDELQDLLTEKGVPESDIAFVHNFESDAKKAKLFSDMREGKVRVLLGSTDKMGVGTNAQTKMVAIHHIDAPWRPADVEQRDGRGVRQGNENSEISLNRYVTEGSFDAYMWQGLERKLVFIEQAMSGDPTIRRMEDISGSVLNPTEAKALASGNPMILEKASVDSDVARIGRLKAAHIDTQFQVRQSVASLPGMIVGLEEELEMAQRDTKRLVPTAGNAFQMRVDGSDYSDRAKAGERLTAAVALFRTSNEDEKRAGSIGGFDLFLVRQVILGETTTLFSLRGALTYQDGAGELTALGMVRRLEGMLGRVGRKNAQLEKRLVAERKKLKDSEALLGQEFAREDELKRLQTRQAEINAALKVDGAHVENEQVSESVDGDAIADETYGPDGLTSAELAERDDAGFLDIRPLMERRRTRDQLITSELPEVEARYQAAKGIQPEGMFERARAAWGRFSASMRRAHPEIDPDESVTMAMNQDILRQFGSSRDFAMATAYNEIRNVTDGLTENQVDLLTRNLVLPDIIKDAEEGLYDGKDELPFGYSSVEEVQADLERFEQAARADAAVSDALDRRGEIARKLTKMLVQAELLPAGVLEDDRYYHRQVMKYFQGKDFSFTGVGGADVRLKEKGFQRGRVGGGDFNTAYQEAEIEWMSQGYELLGRIGTLERLQQLNDIKDTLKKQARILNTEAALDAWAEQGEGIEDPFLTFRTRIAFSNAGLARLAVDGELESVGGRYDDLIEQLGDSHESWKAEMKDRAAVDREAFRFDHSDWFGFLSHVLENQLPGAMQAATIFKAIRQREALTKELAGGKYIDPTNAKELVRKLAPEHQVWQPKKGTHFFLGLTVEERVLEAALEEGRAITREDVRQQMIVGGPREQWIIPGNLARTLDDVKPTVASDAVDNLWRSAQASWKQWVLLNPIRFMKYNLNNMSGDADIAFAYDPAIIKGAVTAAKDMALYYRGKASPEVQKEMLEAIRLGVVGSGLRVAEIPDISESGAFQFLATGKLNPGRRVVNKYWTGVRGFTDWRENILRVAAYRYFQERVVGQNETGIYAASRKSEIDAITNPKERAAKLARELIGDYGNISQGGVWLRRHLIPFYSWIEINAPRYYRLLANAKHEGQSGRRGRNLSIVGAKKGSVAVMKMNVLFLLVNLWNHLFFPEEEEQLGTNRRQLHLILGRREDGSIRSLRVEGALSDALEWFNLQDYPSDIADLIAGRADIQDQGAEFVKAPVERLINSWEPFAKTVFEVAMGRSTFPTVFEEGKSFDFRTRTVRDRTEHVARVFSLDRLYRRVTGRPRRKSQGPIEDLMGVMLLYSTDPGESSYWQVKDLVGDYQAEQGQQRADFTPTRRSTALYYWKRGVQWGDEKAAERWLRRYRELGGTNRGMSQSLTRSAPLGSLAKRSHAAFLATLTPKEADLVDQAQEWYRNVFGGVTPPSARPTRRTVRRR